MRDRFPDWTPVGYFAEVANDTALPVELRLEAARLAASYIHPKPRPIELEPEALIALERDIQRAKLEVAADVVAKAPGIANLAERLERAAAIAAARRGEVVEGAPAHPAGE